MNHNSRLRPSASSADHPIRSSSACHPVAAGLLGDVQCLEGAVQEDIGAGRVAVNGGDAKAGGESEGRTTGDGKAMAGDPLTDSIRARRRGARVESRRDQQKAVSSQTTDQIGG